MIIEALFLAKDLEGTAKKSIVLIDVLRTSATLATMLKSGARNVIVASRPEEARAHRDRLGECLLCGESGGRRLPDFDYGNSPSDYARLDLAGKQIVFTSSNGAKAMAQLVGEGRRLFIGSYPNAAAVVRAALADAERRSADIAIVGSGGDMGTRYGIEDCHCAGFLVDLLFQQMTGQPNWAEVGQAGDLHHIGEKWALQDSAFMALQLYRSLGLDFDRIVQRSVDGQNLRTLGLDVDFPDCLVVDSTDVVPEVTVSPEGYLLVNPDGSLSDRARSLPPCGEPTG